MSRYKGATLISGGSSDSVSIRGVNISDLPEVGEFTETLTLQYTDTGQLLWRTVSTAEVTNNIFATFEETTTDVEYINATTNRSYVMSIELDTPATVAATAERYQLKLYSQDLDEANGTPGNRPSTTLTGAELQTAAANNSVIISQSPNNIEGLTGDMGAEAIAAVYWGQRTNIIR